MIISILGPQGSGKGTQARLLLKKLNLKYIEMGRQLRLYAKGSSRLSKEVSRILQKGSLVPDEIVFKILTRLFEKVDFSRGILFDGFPRTVDQYVRLKEILKSRKQTIDKVIILEIPQSESIRRLSARRVHKTTGKIYNLVTNPPPKTVDRRLLVHRKDDRPEAIVNRLRVYNAQISKIISKAKKDGVLVRIDGNQPIDDVAKEIESSLQI